MSRIVLLGDICITLNCCPCLLAKIKLKIFSFLPENRYHAMNILHEKFKYFAVSQLTEELGVLLTLW